METVEVVQEVVKAVGATEAADEEEATGAAETLEAEAARSNNTCHPAPPRRCRCHQ